jgi:hypothetical protein
MSNLRQTYVLRCCADISKNEKIKIGRKIYPKEFYLDLVGEWLKGFDQRLAEKRARVRARITVSYRLVQGGADWACEIMY